MAPGHHRNGDFRRSRRGRGRDGSGARHDRSMLSAVARSSSRPRCSSTAGSCEPTPRRAIRRRLKRGSATASGSLLTTRTAASAATAISCPSASREVSEGNRRGRDRAAGSAESRATGFDMLAYLERRNRLRGDRRADATCAKAPITATVCSRVSRCSRRSGWTCASSAASRAGAIDVELDCGGTPMRVLATHLGLSPYERREQIQRLLRVLESDRPLPTILMGDINEWFLWGRPLRWMHRHFEETPSPRLSLRSTRLRARPHVGEAAHAAEATRSCTRRRSRASRSDHLPLKAELDLHCGAVTSRARTGDTRETLRTRSRSLAFRTRGSSPARYNSRACPTRPQEKLRERLARTRLQLLRFGFFVEHVGRAW